MKWATVDANEPDSDPTDNSDDTTITSVIPITVQTNIAAVAFTVDGVSYNSTQIFSCVADSSHTIATTSPQSGETGVRYAWTRWSDNGAISHTVAPTTNKTYTATFRRQYYLTMADGTGGTVSPASGRQIRGLTCAIDAHNRLIYKRPGIELSMTRSHGRPNNFSPALSMQKKPTSHSASFTSLAVQKFARRTDLSHGVDALSERELSVSALIAAEHRPKNQCFSPIGKTPGADNVLSVPMPEHTQHISNLSRDFQKSGHATAPTQSGFCSNGLRIFEKLLLALLLIVCAFVSLGFGAIGAAEYRCNSGRRFGLRRCRFQWVPGFPDTEHRFPGD